jgi:hypothetical protein
LPYVAAQLFLRAHGFRAVSILRRFIAATSEDAYLMLCRCRPEGALAAVPARRTMA